MNACGFIFASQGFTVHSERTGMDRKPLVVEDVNYYTRETHGIIGMEIWQVQLIKNQINNRWDNIN